MATTPPRLLLVDDEALTRETLARRLESHGFTVDTFPDGPSVLARISADGAPLPDLVLLDVVLPGYSGLEVLREIRRIGSGDELPVILISALVDSEDVIHGLDAGANDYVVKPINMPVLLARIRACLRIEEAVARLMEAERQRALFQSLHAACTALAEPITPSLLSLELLSREVPEKAAELQQLRAWMSQMADVLHRIRSVAEMRAGSYTDRLDMLTSHAKHP